MDARSTIRLALLLALLAGPATASAAPAATGPLTDRDVPGLLAPLAPGAEVAPGWTCQTWRLDPGMVAVTLQGPEAARLEVHLLPRDDAAPRFSETPSFNVVFRSQPGTVLRSDASAAVQKVADAVRAHDPGGLRLDAGRAQADPPERTESEAGAPWVRASLAACLLALLLASALSGIPAARRTPRWALAGLGLVTAASFATRLLLSPRGFLHEFYHHALWVPDALWSGGFQTVYGDTAPTLYRIADALIGRDEGSIFLANALLSALVPPLTVLLDRALFGRWPRALAAGWLVTFLPLLLRYSASEDPILPAATFALWAMVMALEWVDSRGTPALAGLVAALALAMQCRAEMLAFPAVLAAALVLARGRESLRAAASWRAVAGGAVLCALALPRLLVFRESAPGWLAASAVEGVEHAVLPILSASRWAILLPDATPPWFPVLVLAGAVGSLVTRDLRPLAAGLLPGLWHAVVTSGIFQNTPFLLRTQTFAMPFLAIAAAGTVSLAEWTGGLVARLRHRLVPGRAGAASGLAACAALGVLFPATAACRLDWIVQPTEAMQEWAFLREAVPLLPPGPGILLTVDGSDRRGVDPFPGWLLEKAGRDYRLADIGDGSDGGALPPAAPGMLFYQGMYCHIAGIGEVVDLAPMHPRCRAVRDRYLLKPLRTAALDGVRGSAMTYAEGSRPFEVGFFEVLGDRAPGH